MKYDVIVIGTGSMGSAACYHAARQGRRVLGIDQYEVPHEHGSHGGQSRIIRKAYFEHPDYVPLLHEAYKGWSTLESLTGETIYHQTGIVYFGDERNPTMEGTRRSAKMYDLPLEVIPSATSRARFPRFVVPSNMQTLFEKEAGFVLPEKAIRAFVSQAAHHGAVFVKDRVLSWRNVGDGVEVVTTRDVFKADRLIITAGSWTSELLPAKKPSLKVTLQTLIWVRPQNPEPFILNNMPCWFIEDPQHGMFYGFPILPKVFGEPHGLKIACHRKGEEVDARVGDRQVNSSDVDVAMSIIRKYMPDASGDVVATKTCLYTNSADDDFIIDHWPGTSGKVTVACGFSGHGFKFAPVIGEILCDLAMDGSTRHPVQFLSMSRLGNAEN